MLLASYQCMQCPQLLVCKAVPIGAYAVSNFVMKKLQALAESNCAACIRKCAEGVDFCPSSLSDLL